MVDRLSVIGGGPAGVFLARMVRLTQPTLPVDVYERNPSGPSSGFGVALSSRTMRGVLAHDRQTHERIIQASRPMAGIGVRTADQLLRYDGFPARAIARHTLLAILTEQAANVGARIHDGHAVSEHELPAGVIALADGAGGAQDGARRRRFGTSSLTGATRYIWLGIEAALDDLSVMSFVDAEYGAMATHCYAYQDGMSTVVVEMPEATWRRAGLDRQPTGPSSTGIDEDALDLLSTIFVGPLAGHRLRSDRSRWGRFITIRHDRWWDGRTVLLGDAAHTAHFSVSSGTKMALEDAIALALALRTHADPTTAFQEYERQRRPVVSRTQQLAEPSRRWWETFATRMHVAPAQFGLHFITRAGAVSYLGLRERCPDRVDEAEVEYHRQVGPAGEVPPPAVLAPLRVGPVRLPHRVVTWSAGVGSAGVGSAGRGWVRSSPLPGNVGPTPSSADGPAVPFAFLPCRIDPEWSGMDDQLIRDATRLRAQSDVAGIYLCAEPVEPAWNRTVEYASRLRTESALPVAVNVPAPWFLDLTRSAGVDSWPARVQVALVSGRIDLVVPAV